MPDHFAFLFCFVFFFTWCVTLVIAKAGNSELFMHQRPQLQHALLHRTGKGAKLTVHPFWTMLGLTSTYDYFRVSTFSLWSIALGFQVWLCRCPSSVTCWSIALGQEYKKQDIFRVRRMPGWLGVLFQKHPSNRVNIGLFFNLCEICECT